MTYNKKDPRVLRTRKLLIDSFVSIMNQKKIESITIKDITDEATVNRATFYAHFQDKYDLMDAVISETVLENIEKRINSTEVLNEQTITKLFLIVTEYLLLAESECKINIETYRSPVEQRIKQILEMVLLTGYRNKYPKEDVKTLEISSAFLAWGIHGAAVHWKTHSNKSGEQYIKDALPFIMHKMLHF